MDYGGITVIAHIHFMNDNAISSALAWLQGAVLGTVATTVAVIVVASVGFLMLTGRIDVRRAAQIVFGCFIIFGASTIASGILGAVEVRGPDPNLASAAPPPPPQLPPPPAIPSVAATPYDPYAGAALPPR
jgi:type IV secretory pathway VirB2 component (pilin)